jgi:hypothetical protein
MSLAIGDTEHVCKEKNRAGPIEMEKSKTNYRK